MLGVIAQPVNQRHQLNGRRHPGLNTLQGVAQRGCDLINIRKRSGVATKQGVQSKC